MNAHFDYTGKTVLVTGGSRGIGREICQLFAAAGAKVIVHYKGNVTAANETLSSLKGTGHVLFQADLTQLTEIKNVCDGLFQQHPNIEILINNAGIYEFHPVATTSFEEWHRSWRATINANLVGPAHLTYCFARHWIDNGKKGGRVVNISSRGAFRGEPDAPAYGASKAGMNAWGQSLARALGSHSIFVHTVAPGFVETDMAAEILNGPQGDEIRNQSPLGRVARPTDVARTVLFLASQETEFLTGCIVDVNGASYLRS